MQSSSDIRMDRASVGRPISSALSHPRWQPCFSIVAIHGIGAHPDDTWYKKVDTGGPSECYVNWLKDTHMLPAVVPDARIMRPGGFEGSTLVLRQAVPCWHHSDHGRCSAVRRQMVWDLQVYNRYNIFWNALSKRRWAKSNENNSNCSQLVQERLNSKKELEHSIFWHRKFDKFNNIFFRNETKKNKIHIICFFEQNSNKIDVIYCDNRIQIN